MVAGDYNYQGVQIMNKAELVAALAEKASVSKKDAEAVLNAFTDTVGEQLKKGEKITLVGFGSFEAVKRAARKAKSPVDGKVIQIPATKAPKFRAGKALKTLIAGNKKKK